MKAVTFYVCAAPLLVYGLANHPSDSRVIFTSLLIVILGCIALGALNGIQQAESDGIDTTPSFCMKYVFVYFCFWIVCITFPIALLNLILPYLN